MQTKRFLLLIHARKEEFYDKKNRIRNLLTLGAKRLLLFHCLKISNVPMTLLSKASFIFPTQWFQGG